MLLERAERLGGQIALAGAAPGGAYLAGAYLENVERRLRRTGVDVRLGTAADPESVSALDPDAVVLATGAVPYRGNVDGVSAWDVLAGVLPEGGRILVADWGGDPGGLDAAELLAAAGKDVTYAVASLAVGDRAPVPPQPVPPAALPGRGEDPASRRARFTRRSYCATSSRRARGAVAADAVVLALGRVPAPVFELAGVPVEHAGDCRSPRSLEEAVLEGTLASRTLAASW